MELNTQKKEIIPKKNKRFLMEERGLKEEEVMLCNTSISWTPCTSVYPVMFFGNKYFFCLFFFG